MKKILCLVLCLLMLCSVTACTIEDSPTKETNQTQQPQPTEKPEETFGLNQTAVFKTLKFTATELTESNGQDFFIPETGKVFIGVKFTIENISNEEQTVSSLLLFDAYVDDVKCSYSFNAACAFSDGTLDGTIAPGKKLIGWYAVEVPSNWVSLELNVQADWLSSSSAKFVFKK